MLSSSVQVQDGSESSMHTPLSSLCFSGESDRCARCGMRSIMQVPDELTQWVMRKSGQECDDPRV